VVRRLTTPGYTNETATGATYADGICTYNFTGAIPATAAGTYALEIEGRMTTTLNPGTTKQFTYNDSGENVVKYFAVTGTTVTPRRTVVDTAKCNKCHDKLQFHGNNRNQVAACVLCHNPTATYRPSGSTEPAESIDMRTMVHKIHTGEELEGDYTIGTTNFNGILYPGDRRNCLACHVGTSYQVPLPSTNLAVTTPRDLWSPTLPNTASCIPVMTAWRRRFTLTSTRPPSAALSTSPAVSATRRARSSQSPKLTPDRGRP